MNHHGDQKDDDRITVGFDGIGTLDLPHSFFVHAYALTSYAVQGSTSDVSTSRVDATATCAETYVNITRGRLANHLYLTLANCQDDGPDR